MLSDPQKRRVYDTTGNENGTDNGFGGAGYSGQGFAFQDIFDTFFGAGGSAGPASRVRRGQDALISVRIDLRDAVFGVNKKLEVDTAVAAPPARVPAASPDATPSAATSAAAAARYSGPSAPSWARS